jgi:hypothetical protein
VFLARGSLGSVRDAFETLARHTRLAEHPLFLVDAGCDGAAWHWITHTAGAEQEAALRIEPGTPPEECMARSLALGTSTYLAIVASEVVVPPDWLPRLLRRLSEASISRVEPLSTGASGLPLAPGANFFGLDRALERLALAPVACQHSAGTPCTVIRRPGGKARRQPSLEPAGEELLLARDVLVHRRRDVLQSGEVRTHRERLTRPPEFVALRPRTRAWVPGSRARQTWRSMRSCWRRRDAIGVTGAALDGAVRMLTERRPAVSSPVLARVTRPSRLTVTYVLQRLALTGGVLSVVQLVNELITQGVEARIAALDVYPETSGWNLLTEPMLFRSPRELVHKLPRTDLAVATFWKTAPWVAALTRTGRAGASAYFIQDYEPWFEPERRPNRGERVRDTYRLIPHRIVKSDWLADRVRQHGFASHKIRLGMDLGCFYPRGSAVRKRSSVLAMARPGTPWRGFPSVVAALGQVHEALPGLEITLFGEDLTRGSVPFPHQSLGSVGDRDRLAMPRSSWMAPTSRALEERDSRPWRAAAPVC